MSDSTERSGPTAHHEAIPEPDLPYRLHDAALEHHATALGYVCITYSELELTINSYIEKLLVCSQEERRAIVDGTGNSIISRCTLVKKLAQMHAPNQEWLIVVERHLKHVESSIAPLRNRMIHDPWISPADLAAPIQLDQRLRAKPKGSAGQARPEAPVDIERTLESVWLLVKDIQHMSVILGRLLTIFDVWKREGRLLELPA